MNGMRNFRSGQFIISISDQNANSSSVKHSNENIVQHQEEPCKFKSSSDKTQSSKYKFIKTIEEPDHNDSNNVNNQRFINLFEPNSSSLVESYQYGILFINIQSLA